ncbi:MAG: hypothetical protein GQ538_09455 [Xanthomonadales bacterium]|nr:hypothetical protein [Xanthomonadales bacterium]
MVLIPYLTVIRFSGTEAGDFLHNQISADVLALSNGESTFACYCEPKGRVLALMLVSRSNDDYLVIMSGSLAASVAARMKIYVMRAKVDIEVLDSHEVVGVYSDDKPHAVDKQMASLPVPDSSKAFLVRPAMSTQNSAADELDQWKLSELQAGISWLCPETSGQFLPQMLGFDRLGAVNYRKGCYPGQEIVARTHYLGKVKRHPRLVCSHAMICPNPLDKLGILSGDQSYAGVITDCVHRKDSGACILVVTRMDPDLIAEKIEYQGQEAKIQ